MAFAAAAAVAFAGAITAQGWLNSERANAVTFLGGWDGKFTEDILWYNYQQNGGETEYSFGWRNVGGLTPSSYSSPARLFEATGKANGSASPLGNTTIGVGPVAKTARGTMERSMVSLNSAGDIGMFVPSSGSVDYSRYTTLKDSKGVSGVNLNNCHLQTSHGVDVNKDNGYVYVTGKRLQNDPGVDGNASSVTWPFAIYRMEGNTDPDHSSRKQLTCMAAITSIYPVGDTLNQQWIAATGSSPSGNWAASADLVVDATGGVYVMLTNGADRHALVQFVVPRLANGDPDPSATSWGYTLVKAFTETTIAAPIEGMAYVDGLFYTIEGDSNQPSLRRWDPVTGSSVRLGAVPAATVADLAGTQPAPEVIQDPDPALEGTVYHDKNGDGAIGSGETGLANQTVEVWLGNAASNSSSWTLQETLKTDAQGKYATKLKSHTGEYVVRVKQPTINGVNAAQSYASAGDFKVGSKAANLVRGLCASSTGNYQQKAQSGKCTGGRMDGTDPSSVSNPLANQGGAAIVSYIKTQSEESSVTANFGLTTSGSWGDAPDTYRTTNAQQGPYANPNIVYLGSKYTVYTDGQPGAGADAHASDDGLQIAPVPANGTPSASDWVPAQNQTLTSGSEYWFRAKVSAPSGLLSSTRVKGWISGLNSNGTAATTFNENLLGSGGSCSDVPDSSGYVSCRYKVSAVAPQGGSTPVYARIRVGTDTAMTATSRGPSNSSNSGWMPAGEVEDYRLNVAGGGIR
ncbi:MAG: hypothetical protein LBO75_01670, partial [Bifidobacteriaceae bacterium]|nr:hypothetical protein [Bifidobacteriaceae bacterium]